MTTTTTISRGTHLAFLTVKLNEWLCFRHSLRVGGDTRREAIVLIRGMIIDIRRNQYVPNDCAFCGRFAVSGICQRCHEARTDRMIAERGDGIRAPHLRAR